MLATRETSAFLAVLMLCGESRLVMARKEIPCEFFGDDAIFPSFRVNCQWTPKGKVSFGTGF
jgi:hypothetical protein